MKSIYFEKDDILHIRVSDKTVVREVSPGLAYQYQLCRRRNDCGNRLAGCQKRGADAYGVASGGVKACLLHKWATI